jgi:Mn2+/Fe2+ NRAMP family transporter
VRVATAALLTLVTANIGTAAAEVAGIAAGSELLGVSRYVSVPVSAVGVTALVLLGSFRRVAHWLLALPAVFVAYVGAGLLAHRDWHAAVSGLLVPRMGLSHTETVLVAATVGTTLAPRGLSFIQSYAVDKKLTVQTCVLGRHRTCSQRATLTGVIGFFVVVACAEVLHARGLHIETAADAAQALTPVTGDLDSTLFAEATPVLPQWHRDARRHHRDGAASARPSGRTAGMDPDAERHPAGAVARRHLE